MRIWKVYHKGRFVTRIYRRGELIWRYIRRPIGIIREKLLLMAKKVGTAALQVAMAYLIEDVGPFDLAGDVIIGNGKVIIMGYALAEPAAGA